MGVEHDAMETKRKECKDRERRRKRHAAEQEKQLEYLKDLEPKYVGVQSEMESSDAGALLLDRFHYHTVRKTRSFCLELTECQLKDA